MDRGENAGSGGGAALHIPGKNRVTSPGVLQVAVLGLLRERPRVQPFQKLQIHPQTAEAVLWRVQMEIRQPGDDQPVAEVL